MIESVWQQNIIIVIKYNCYPLSYQPECAKNFTAMLILPMFWNIKQIAADLLLNFCQK